MWKGRSAAAEGGAGEKLRADEEEGYGVGREEVTRGQSAEVTALVGDGGRSTA